MRNDAQISGPQQRYIAASDAVLQLSSSMGIPELEVGSQLGTCTDCQLDTPDSDNAVQADSMRMFSVQ
jgi:hypothetical protein